MAQRRCDVVGLGYTALDYLGIVPRFPEENRKLELVRFKVGGGGPTATALVTVRRLGLSACFLGKVGDDALGSQMLAELEVEGVDVSPVIIERGATSQFAFIMVDEGTAARTILWTRGSVSRIRPEEVDRGLVTSGRILLVDTLEPEAAAVAAEEARARGVPVVIDAGTVRDGVLDILPFCDYIVASEIFAEQISGGKDLETSLKEIYSFGPKAAVVTLGERGCAAFDGNATVEVDGFDVEAVDTTGAGDVFHGAFLYSVIQCWDIYRACLFSNAVAALKCRCLGGREGIPTLAEAIAFIAERRPDVSFTSGGGSRS
jgi:sulfofructose kinase